VSAFQTQDREQRFWCAAAATPESRATSIGGARFGDLARVQGAAANTRFGRRQ